jgi:hypothetical protein
MYKSFNNVNIKNRKCKSVKRFELRMKYLKGIAGKFCIVDKFQIVA